MRITAALAVLSVTALAGCYGQTDLASQVTGTGATLNARGSTQDKPAQTWFEYWRASAPAQRSVTPTRALPAGLGGRSIRTRLEDLGEGVLYAYRLCGRDVGGPTVCAQTRRFETGVANAQVWGSSGGLRDLDFDGFGPADGHAGGLFGDSRFGSIADGNVNCVYSEGDTAVIGFDNGPAVLYVQMWDRGPAGSGDDRIAFLVGGPGRAADDCSFFASYDEARRIDGDVAVSSIPLS